MKKVLFPEPVHEAGMKLLEGKVEVVVAPDTTKETILALVEDVHGIVLRTTAKIDKDIIEKANDLLVISRTGAGVDNVDVEEATKRGIMVCNLPGANALSVAEHTVAFILALAKQLKFMDTSTRRGEWKNRNRYEAVDLERKVLGLVGAGKIGQKVAKMCQQAFQMKVIAYDPYVGKGGEVKEGIEFKDKIKEVFEEADF
ncbi:hydroxyacid dehydrogenase, partial [Candidatus Aerophobetes bacterium]|nr:hydroxyacid dehydrogenase [Candidatus Aerophobetes bacterium]